MITPRENLLKVFRHEVPEWVPIIVLADGYNRPAGMPPGFYEGFEDEESGTVLALSEYFDIDVFYRVDGAWAEGFRNVRYRSSLDGGVETRRWETPYGVITTRLKEVRFPSRVPDEPDLATSFPVEYPVKSVQDYRAFAHRFADLQYEFNPDLVARRALELGERGIVAVAGPSSPLGMCVRYYTGVEHLALAYSDHPRELRQLLEQIGEKYCECYRGIAQADCDAAIIPDDTTTQAISPAMFRELAVPYINRFADILHEAGKVCIHHACGHIFHLLEDLRGTRVDVLDGPSPPPQGDTSVAQAREKLGPRMAIMPFTKEDTLKSGDPGLIRGYIRRMFEEAGSPENWIVNVLPPPGVAVANVWLAVDEAKRLSRQFSSRCNALS